MHHQLQTARIDEKIRISDDKTVKKSSLAIAFLGMICYNIFRDEFFGEARINNVPDINYEFDSVTVKDLQEKISTHLIRRLKLIREEALQSIEE